MSSIIWENVSFSDHPHNPAMLICYYNNAQIIMSGNEKSFILTGNLDEYAILGQTVELVIGRTEKVETLNGIVADFDNPNNVGNGYKGEATVESIVTFTVSDPSYWENHLSQLIGKTVAFDVKFDRLGFARSRSAGLYQWPEVTNIYFYFKAVQSESLKPMDIKRAKEFYSSLISVFDLNAGKLSTLKYKEQGQTAKELTAGQEFALKGKVEEAYDGKLIIGKEVDIGIPYYESFGGGNMILPADTDIDMEIVVQEAYGNFQVGDSVIMRGQFQRFDYEVRGDYLTKIRIYFTATKITVVKK